MTKELLPKETRVLFIGLGRMGINMAKQIVSKGYELVVWNRTREKVKELTGLGARVAEDPKSGAQGADAVVSMLSTPQVTENVILGREEYRGIGVIDGLRKGSILIDMSTNSLEVVRTINAQVSEKGIEFIDAPVLGGPAMAAQGALTILASGNEDTVKRAMPLLSTMGRKIWYMGPVGSGTIAKIALNLHLFLLMGALAESISLAKKLGLEPSKLIEVLNDSAHKTYISELKGKNIVTGNYEPTFMLKLALKDLNLASESALRANIPLPLGNTLRDLYAMATALGLGELDFSAIAKYYEQLVAGSESY